MHQSTTCRTYLVNAWSTFACLWILLALSGCSRPSKDQGEMPEITPRPFHYPANLDEGYTVNPVFGNEVQPYSNSVTDSIATGIPFNIEGEVVAGDQLRQPEPVVVGKPRTRPAYSLWTPLLPPRRVTRIPYPAQVSGPEGHARDQPLIVNSLGDTIPTNVERIVRGLVTPYRAPRPVTARSPARRYDAVCSIHSIGTEQGLIRDFITALAEDHHGRIWIGTYLGGVSCYDGSLFHNLSPVNGLINTVIYAIHEDRSGRMWFATSRGISLFDGQRFLSLGEPEGLSGNSITCMAEDGSGNIWCGTAGKGLFRIHPVVEADSFRLMHFGPQQGVGLSINGLTIDRNEQIWIANGKDGVTLGHLSEQEAFEIHDRLDSGRGLSGDHVLSTALGPSGDVWLGTSKGLFRYLRGSQGNPATLFHERLTSRETDPPVNALLFDRSGHLWIGTSGQGVFRLDKSTNSLSSPGRIAHYGEQEGLTNLNISTLLEDRQGNIWAGTEGGGVCQIQRRMFYHFSEREGLTRFPVSAIHEDLDGAIWFGTQGDGVIRYRRGDSGDEAVVEHFDEENGWPNNDVSTIAGDPHGGLWLGTSHFGQLNLTTSRHSPAKHEGLFHFTGDRCFIYTAAHGLTGNDINALRTDQAGNLWIGTATGLSVMRQPDKTLSGDLHIIRFTERQGLFRNFISNIFIDRRNDVWIGSFGGGVSRFMPLADVSGGSIMHFSPVEGLPFHNVLSMAADNPGEILLGTGDGLVRFSYGEGRERARFTFYGLRARLVGNNIRSILTDPSGQQWLGTLRGLRVVRDSTHNGHEPLLLSLGRGDGLKSEEFIANSALIDRDGRAWWGTQAGGVEMLDLHTWDPTPPAPTPILHNIEINGEFVDFRSLPDSLQKQLELRFVNAYTNRPDGLVLAHNLDHLTFHFSASNPGTPGKTRYSFRMIGLREGWSAPSSLPWAEYRSLPPGRYTFKVAAAGEDGQWSHPVDYLFTIRPPWWLTGWAMMAYALGICFAGYRVYRFQLSRRLALADKQRLVEHDRLKNKLYTNITHEFRTPLTLIHGPLARALSTRSPLTSQDMQSMIQQSRRLQQLITQMLDLQRAEAGKLKPTYILGDIVAFTRYVTESFSVSAGEREISMEVKAAPDKILMDYDEEKMTQVITNLLSNALRHTPRQGRIDVALRRSDNDEKLWLEIADTGPGIPAEDLPFVFDRYYQSAHANSGSLGIGLELTRSLIELLGGRISVRSEPGQGAVFTVQLPIRQTASPKPVGATGQPWRGVLPDDDEERFPVPVQAVSDKPLALIVEDHPEVARFVAECLAGMYATRIAGNGEEGITLALEHVPDIIISDIMMPDTDGFELCARLKSDIHTSHIPIILLTGRGDRDAMLTGIRHGADAYLVKPFEPDELVLRAQKLLELRAELQAYYRRHADEPQSDATRPLSGQEHQFITSLRTFVEEHLNDPQFNMQMICRHLAISHPQLHRKLVALTGESAGKFVRAVRLSRASALLRQSDLTVSEIAYETGFSDPGYFTKVFSREFNMTPSEFRQMPPGPSH